MKKILQVIKSNKLMSGITLFLLFAISLSVVVNFYVLNRDEIITIQHFVADDTLEDGRGQKVKVILLKWSVKRFRVGSVYYLQEKSEATDYLRYEPAMIMS
jgi:hypothetical protein